LALRLHPIVSVYGNRYVGADGAIFWNTSIAGEHERVKDYWIADDGIHHVSTHLWIDHSGRSQIIVHEIADDISETERSVISTAIATWERKLAEHDQLVNLQ
jgi:hypothetical protein